jgi:CO/xanthine dehydrogenase FAD-binding subunit
VLLALLVLEASLVLQGDQEQVVSLSEFINSGCEISARQYLTEVRFAQLSGAGVGAALERVARTAQDEAIVTVAAVLQVDRNIVRTGQLAVAGAGLAAQRLTSAENLLAGRKLDQALAAQVVDVVKSSIAPVSDYRASADYQREMAGVLTQRALWSAWAMEGRGQ